MGCRFNHCQGSYSHITNEQVDATQTPEELADICWEKCQNEKPDYYCPGWFWNDEGNFEKENVNE